MTKINSFAFVTLNGFLYGKGGDISWHRHGAEENQYAADKMASGSTLLFGRKTYEMMASYWPTPEAARNDAIVAEGMNRARKLVVSTTLNNTDPIVSGWGNTTILSLNAVAEITRMKESSVNDITILGSGSIVTLLAEKDLIDEFQIMIDPVVIGSGTPIFNQIKTTLNLKLTNVRKFTSGVVLLSYKPC
jgi:dihydrofolate reductase